MGALDGKAVVITGAGRGVGAACARAVAAEGGAVVVNDIDRPEAEAVAAAIVASGGRAVADGSDVRSWSAAASLVEHCIDEYGALDGLVNNAGVFVIGTPEETTEAEWRDVIETNVLGVAFCGTHALAHMSRRGSGSIVNVTSGAHAGSPLQSCYSASKGAVASLTYGWAIEAGPRGVRVNAMTPMAATRMSDAVQGYFRRRGETPWPRVLVAPENNAPVVTFLLSDDAADVHGQVVRIDGERLSLMSHPAVLHPPVVRASWTHADVRAAFAAVLSARQQPLGLVGTTAELVPYVAAFLPAELRTAVPVPPPDPGAGAPA